MHLLVIIACFYLMLGHGCLANCLGANLLWDWTGAWQGNILLIVELLVQLEVFVIQDDLDDALKRVLPLVKECFESVRDFFKHERRWVKQLHHIDRLDVEAQDERRATPDCQ